MSMMYFQYAGATYGYDSAYAPDAQLIAAAEAAGWINVTGAWPPAPPAPTLAQQAQALVAAGLTVSSTSTPALNGTYAADATTTAHINAEVTAILLTGNFADGGSTVAWPDIAGTLHTFPSTMEFKAFAVAVAGFVAGAAKAQNGAATALPAAAISIA